MFGVFSTFSGQPMYEPWLYQIYNITYTSFPIIFYSLFDFEKPKEILMYTPDLFRIGMTNAKFDITTLFMWIFYSSYHAAQILFLCYTLPCDTAVENGKTFSFWPGGHMVYFMTVAFSNLVILKLQNSFSGYNEVLMLGHIAFYFVSVYYW